MKKERSYAFFFLFLSKIKNTYYICNTNLALLLKICKKGDKKALKLKQITKKILAFGLAVATTCASFLSVPQNAFADSPKDTITVVDYASYGSQKAAFDAVMTNQHGDKYGY